jgi:hypothetical protein
MYITKGFEMNITNLTTPQIEHLVLRKNAFTIVFTGLFFLTQLIYDLVSTAQSSTDLKLGFSLVSVFFLIGLLVNSNTVSKLARKVKKAYWYGNFDDEYFNFLNHKAYKYGFNSAGIVALIIYSGPNIMPESLLTTDNSLRVVISIMCLAYGAPLLFWLRGNDE